MLWRAPTRRQFGRGPSARCDSKIVFSNPNSFHPLPIERSQFLANLAHHPWRGFCLLTKGSLSFFSVKQPFPVPPPATRRMSNRISFWLRSRLRGLFTRKKDLFANESIVCQVRQNVSRENSMSRRGKDTLGLEALARFPLFHPTPTTPYPAETKNIYDDAPETAQTISTLFVPPVNKRKGSQRMVASS